MLDIFKFFKKPIIFSRMRIGHGYDVHKMEKNNPLILCGVNIPFEKGLAGHSDADVATHAAIDAILGAAACPDIGTLFPDDDDKFKNIDSLFLLKKAKKIIAKKNYKISNLDLTIIAQLPKLKPHIENMRKKLAKALNIEKNQVNIKATTEEGLGFTGKQKGIAAHCVALLFKKK